VLVQLYSLTKQLKKAVIDGVFYKKQGDQPSASFAKIAGDKLMAVTTGCLFDRER